MLRAIAIAAIVVSAAPPRASADPDAEADAALRAADQRAVARDPAAIDAYEAIGGATPVTRWTDHAWLRAAGMAEQAGELTRARRDLERAIAINGDPRLVERARADLARLTASTGGGRWDRVVAEHTRLAGQLGSGDPKPALVRLEALVTANPGYPGAGFAVLTIAQGWERDGDAEHAIGWLQAQRGAAGSRIAISLIRLYTRHGDIARAEAALGDYAADPGADRAIVLELRAGLATSTLRRWLRTARWTIVALIAAAAIIQLVRGARGRDGALRRLARPPSEVVFLLPIGAVLIAVAGTGNPMVARAVRQVVIAGLAIAWLSGALLEARRQAHGLIAAPRALAHAAVALIAVGAAAYLALDHDHMIDLVIETWRGGPAMR